MTRRTREKEKPERLKRKRSPFREYGGLVPPPSILTTLQCCPLIFLSLQDHLAAYTLRHLRRYLLRQFLRTILRFLYAVFQDILHQESRVVVTPVLAALASRITSLSLFIMLLSKRRLKALGETTLVACFVPTICCFC